MLDLKRRELEIMEKRVKIDLEKMETGKELKMREIEPNLKREELLKVMMEKFETK